jgi:N-methylhydantoinase A
MRFAVDTGGTFTDLVIEDEQGYHAYKVPTTPDDPIRGVLDVLTIAADARGVSLATLLRQGSTFIHATTRAINAILTGNTAKTAFLTTEGHPDILLFREGGRSDPFNFTNHYPDPYVPRSLTFEVPGRIGASGEVVQPLDEAAVVALARELKGREVEAVGVCLLWSIVNPAHEARVGALLAEHLPGVPVTLSHTLNPVIREYRRASAACIDASLKPVMSTYLQRLENRLCDAGFGGRVLVVTSSGGVADAAVVAEAPILTVNSGPAMAPVAGRGIARRETGSTTVIVTDAGGTTYDVSLVRRGEIPMTDENWIGARFFGHITGFPSVDIHSIGAGGGSIAWVDDGGLLHVGPRSAGADPGPVCYGHGGSEPTVTDACVVLGYLDPNQFLGGAIRLDAEGAARAITERVGTPLGLDQHAAAAAILELATEHMVHAIESVTVDQGIDPAAAVLIGGGGASGLNAGRIAARLGCDTVVIPEHAAVMSAAGALMSDLTASFNVTAITSSEAFDSERVNGVLDQLKALCRRFIGEAGDEVVEHGVDFSVDVRYAGQTWELEMPLRIERFTSADDIARLRADFDALHQEVFAIQDQRSAIECITWRARAWCQLPDMASLRAGARTASRGAALTRPAWFPGLGLHATPVHRLEQLPIGEHFSGPCIVESPLTTVIVEPGDVIHRTEDGALLLRPAVQRRPEQGDATMAAPRERALAGVGVTGAGAPLDGLRLAILNNRFQAIVRKMANTLARTGRAGVLNTARDFSCCILTAADELLATAESLPIHVMSGPDLMAKEVRRLHPHARRGDAYFHNSPYHGNSHAADHCLVIPVIDDDGVQRYTVLVKAHQADCGNAIPTTYSATARDVYEEGALIFHAVQVQRNYQDIDDIIRMCELRIRVPEQWWGDYLAMLGAARIGERELLALGREVGWEALASYQHDWFGYSEQRMIAAVAGLPAGSVTMATAYDPVDGFPEGIPLAATVTVDPAAARIDVDLRDNPDCLPNGLNLTEATARTAAMIGIFNSLVDLPPPNAGSFRRIQVHLRENCIVGIPRHPASCSVATTNVADRVGNMVQRAFAELAEGAGMAEAGLILGPGCAVVSGADPRHGGRPFMNHLFLGFAGGAAGPTADAWLTMMHIGNAGVIFRDSVELDELQFPLRVVEQRLVLDSEGAGRFRGSPSVRTEFGPLDTPMDIVYNVDGVVSPTRGVRGGHDGTLAWQWLRAVDGTETPLPGIARVTLQPGETIVACCGGGGGYGSPLDRDRQQVRRDVREGWISCARAEAVYGLTITEDDFVPAGMKKWYRDG